MHAYMHAGSIHVNQTIWKLCENLLCTCFVNLWCILLQADSVPDNQTIWYNNKKCGACSVIMYGTQQQQQHDKSLVCINSILSWHMLHSYTATRNVLLAVWVFMVQRLHSKSMVHPLLTGTCMLIPLLPTNPTIWNNNNNNNNCTASCVRICCSFIFCQLLKV
jgi:hypothetical protein